MRTAVRLVGTFERRSQVGDLLRGTGDVALIVRGRPRLLVVRCPCGCGEEYAINLDPDAGKAWRLYVRDDKVTLFPSVWRDSGCEAHYILWNSSAYVITGHDHRFEDDDQLLIEPEQVLEQVGTTWVYFVDLADKLGIIPWDILDTCRALVRLGKLEEGRMDLWGHFRRLRDALSVRA